MAGLPLCAMFALSQCALAIGMEFAILQPKSAMRVRLGAPVTLQCHLTTEFSYTIFWQMFSPNTAPVCLATAQSHSEHVQLCETLKNRTDVHVTWNKTTFSLSFSAVEETDLSTYYCGAFYLKVIIYGNGTKLVLENEILTTNTTMPSHNTQENTVNWQLCVYMIPILATTNITAFLVFGSLLCHSSRGYKSSAETTGVNTANGEVNKSTDEVDYAALEFGGNKRRTKGKKGDSNISVIDGVIYGAVKHEGDS